VVYGGGGPNDLRSARGIRRAFGSEPSPRRKVQDGEAKLVKWWTESINRSSPESRHRGLVTDCVFQGKLLRRANADRGRRRGNKPGSFRGVNRDKSQRS